MPECAFCPQTASLSAEHLWGDWIGELFPAKQFHFRKKLANDKEVVEWVSKDLDMTARVVCERCNNTWMSDLENNHAKPTLTPMIMSPSRVTLDRKGQTSIAAFAFKTAVIGDHMQRFKPPYFSEALRRGFARSLTIPRNAFVWIGRIDESSSRHGMFNMEYNGTRSSTMNAFDIYTVTWGAGSFLFQLVALRWKSARRRRTVSVDFKQDPEWDNYATPVWPVNESVEWPPPLPFADSHLERFFHRIRRVVAPAGRL